MTDADCRSKADACRNGSCRPVVDADCHADEDCTTPEPCQLGDDAYCLAGECHYLPREAGVACDDEDPCTQTDACNGAGACVGVSRPCVMPPAAECIGNDNWFVTYATTGTCDPLTGECRYDRREAACPSCTEKCLVMCNGVTCPDIEGGCQIGGRCVPTAPIARCEYELADVGTHCSLPGETEALSGFCDTGICVECLTASDCVAAPGHSACFETACTAGACSYAVQEGRLCQTQRCRDGLLQREYTCDDTGQCSPPTPPVISCSGYACDETGTTCRTSCANPAHCAPGLSCRADNTCEPARINGESCTADAACASGFCVDGVCCESACDGVCRACGSDGRCNVAPADDDACGTIDCDGLDRACRDYADVTADRCAGFGACKVPNTDAGCTVYTDAAAGSEGSDGGCPICQDCDGAGACANIASGQQDVGCNAGATVCSNADTCNGQGQCTANHLPAGGEGNSGGCPVCQDCNGAGACANVASGQQDTGCDGGTTVCSNPDWCSAGTCQRAHLSSGSEGNSGGCPICQDCNGTGDCTNVTSGQQDVGCNAGATVCSARDECQAGLCDRGDDPNGAPCMDPGTHCDGECFRGTCHPDPMCIPP